MLTCAWASVEQTSAFHLPANYSTSAMVVASLGVVVLQPRSWCDAQGPAEMQQLPGLAGRHIVSATLGQFGLLSSKFFSSIHSACQRPTAISSQHTV